MTQRGVDQAVKAAGSQSALARMMQIKPQAVQKWVAQGYVPPFKAKRVSDLTGVSVRDLLTDLEN